MFYIQSWFLDFKKQSTDTFQGGNWILDNYGKCVGGWVIWLIKHPLKILVLC